MTAVEAAAELAGEHGVPFILNPAPARKLPARLLCRVHTLTPNAAEAEVLTELRDPPVAARMLCRRGCGRVVVTLGARGAWLCGDGGDRLVPAPRAQSADTVGAGDCFSAWLAVGLAEGLAIRAAAMAVTRAGAQAGMLFRRKCGDRPDSVASQ